VRRLSIPACGFYCSSGMPCHDSGTECSCSAQIMRLSLRCDCRQAHRFISELQQLLEELAVRQHRVVQVLRAQTE